MGTNRDSSEGMSPMSGVGTSAVRRPTLISAPLYELLDGRPVLIQRVRLYGSGRNEGQVKIVTGDGGTEGTVPIGAIQPTVRGWRIADGTFVPGDVLYHTDGLAEVELIVNAVPDAVLDINVTGQA